MATPKFTLQLNAARAATSTIDGASPVTDNPREDYLATQAAKTLLAREKHRIEQANKLTLTPVLPPEKAAKVEVVPAPVELPTPDPIDYESDTRYTTEPRASDNNSIIPDVEHCGLWDPSITLDESQVAAIDAMLDKQYACLIGAAGTGKTTVTKYLLKKIIYDVEESKRVRVTRTNLGLNIALVAFTGMAVQVIKQNVPEWLRGSCHTIHGLLEFVPAETEIVDKRTGERRLTQTFQPSRDKNNKLQHDVIVIDEASMLGMDLWNQLREACKPGTRIIMIGDLNQLPPIIGEPIFAYALSNWHVSELTHVHRQKEPGANRIVDVAHDILNGRVFQFDDPKTNPNWRVIGFKINSKPDIAAREVLALLNGLRTKRVSPDVDRETPLIYDPLRDRVMTAGNGYDTERTSSFVQQAPLNDTLSILIQPPNEEHPRYLIDGGRVVRKFMIGDRVMATKNESPATLNRVTNGMTGVIRSISRNGNYVGNAARFGSEQEVQEYTKRVLQGALDEQRRQQEAELLSAVANFELESDEEIAETVGLRMGGEEKNEEESASQSSHIVTVEFANGAIRQFRSKPGIESLQLAYASTVAKCQGSQFPTALIVVHEAGKNLMSREWLYTAVTRAQQRVIMFYTEYGIRFSLSKQKISGKNLKEKIERYAEVMRGVENPLLAGTFIRKSVKLTVEE